MKIIEHTIHPKTIILILIFFGIISKTSSMILETFLYQKLNFGNKTLCNFDTTIHMSHSQ